MRQILDDPEAPISCDVIQKLRTEVETVLVGDFVKANDELRIAVRLQDASTCTTLSTAMSLPSDKETRRYHHLAGQLALARGHHDDAVRELALAASMLPPRGVWGSSPAQHVPIWYSLGSAYLASGDQDRAFEYFRRISESGYEHIRWPIPYVRSFYFLARIHEERGEVELAKKYYRRFHELWRDGDLDRERVEEAARKASS